MMKAPTEQTPKKGGNFLHSQYFKDIFSQAGLVVVAQMIPVIFSPLISRIYNENAFAEITGLLAFGGLLLVFSTFKLENAVIIEKQDSRARQLVVLSSLIALVFAAFCFLFISVFKELIVHTFKIQNVVQYVPVYILFFSLLNILNYWFVRIKKFKMKAYSKIVENGSYILMATFFYWIAGDNEFGLASGKMLGVLVAFLFLFTLTKVKFGTYSLRSQWSLLKQYKEFPLHYMPSSFVNIISLQILVIFIGYYFTKEDLGFFGLANMVMLLPISFITQSVGTIFFQKTTEHINAGQGLEAKKVFYQTSGILACIAIPAFLLLLFGSRYLFPIVFGENWVTTGILAELLAIVFLTQFIVGPLSIILISLKKIKLNAIWQYGRFILITLYMLGLVYIFELSFIEFIRWYAYGAAGLYTIYALIIIWQVNKLENTSGDAA